MPLHLLPPQPLRRATAGDKLFAQLAHQAQLLCLLARAVAFDTAADEPEVAALVLSLLPPKSLAALTAPPAGRGWREEEVEALSGAFAAVFLHVRPDEASAPALARSRGGAHAAAPSLPLAARAALTLALARKNGGAEELSALFAALCRARGVPARTAHCLCPQPLKPDASSLDASQGLSGDVREWAPPRRRGRFVVPFGMGPGLRAPQPRARPRPGPAKPSAKAAATSGDADVIDLTLISDGEEMASDAKGKAPALPAGASQRRRGDEELARDLAHAMEASRGGLAEPSVSPPPSKPKTGAAKPKAKAGDSQRWEVGDAAWSRARGCVRHWVEVYLGSFPGGRWVAVMPWERRQQRSGLDVTELMEVCAQGIERAPLTYVLACAGGGARDVTQRYARQWSATQQLRTDQRWWEGSLKALGLRRLEGQAGKRQLGGTSAKAIAHAEDASLEARALAEPFPTRIADFKTHKLYVLERHLTHYECVHPKDALGAIGSEAIYPRKNVAELHTADVWQREYTRCVRDEELATPAKTILKRGLAAAAKKADKQDAADAQEAGFAPKAKAKAKGKGKAGALGNTGQGFDIASILDTVDDDYDADEPGDGCGSDGTDDPTAGRSKKDLTLLYGEWQTDEWEQPGAQGGIVPRNNFGNVDLMRDNPLPPGCVHLSGYPRIGITARRLGVDAPSALVGFERHGGKMTPVLDGIVVPEEHSARVLDAYLAEEEARQAKANAKRRAEALKRWRLLIRTHQERLRLTSEAAGNGGRAAPADSDVIMLDDDGEPEVTPQARAPARASLLQEKM